MAQRTVQIVFGIWLLVMFIMTVLGWRPPASILSEDGLRWAEVNLRPDMMVALAVIYGVGAGTFLTNRFVALGSAVQVPLAVNMAMYHAFVNQVLVPGGVIASVFCVFVALMLWFNRHAYAPLLKPRLD